MSNNNSITGSQHIRVILDAALDAKAGIRIPGLTHERAIFIRGQLHSFRNQERRKAAKAFPIDDPKHNTSAYDCLITEMIQREDGHTDLTIIRSDFKAMSMDLIDEATGEKVDVSNYL